MRPAAKATARVVSQSIVAASARVAERLQLAKGTKVMQIKRVRLAGGLPISFDETYLPLPLGKQIVRNDFRLHPIFTLLGASLAFNWSKQTMS